jgi:hypothetical protein
VTTYTAPTAAQLRAEIASTKARMHDWLCEGRLDSDTEREMLGEITDMENELEEIESMEPVPDKYAPTGGLNIPLCMAAFGMSEEELDKVFGEPR